MSDALVCELFGRTPVFRVGKFFDEVCGKELNKPVDEHLCAGREAMVVDFSTCKVNNSPGVGKLLETVLKVVNDFQGTLFVTGLDSLKKRVFLIATILPAAKEAATTEDALRLIGNPA